MSPLEQAIEHASRSLVDGRMSLPQALRHLWEQGRREERLDNERMRLAEIEGRRLSRAGRGRGR